MQHHKLKDLTLACEQQPVLGKPELLAHGDHRSTMLSPRRGNTAIDTTTASTSHILQPIDNSGMTVESSTSGTGVNCEVIQGEADGNAGPGCSGELASAASPLVASSSSLLRSQYKLNKLHCEDKGSIAKNNQWLKMKW